MVRSEWMDGALHTHRALAYSFGFGRGIYHSHIVMIVLYLIHPEPV